MKTRGEYTRRYLDELETFLNFVNDECKAAGYESIDEAYETIINKPPLCEEIPTEYNGYSSEEDYYLATLIHGIYEFEKPFFRACRRYDVILEKLVISDKIVAKKEA